MKNGRTRYVLLGLLTEAPKSGYQLKQEIDEVIGHFWNESYGQIYPELQRMVGEEMVERTPEANGRRERHLYRITEAGRAELSRWLREPAEPERVRNELLLKLFFGSNTSPEVLRGHLRAFRERTEAFLAMLHSVEGQLAATAEQAPQTAYWRMTLHAGEAVARARMAWADQAIGTLAGLAADGGDNTLPGENDA
ncbi:MAG TPA: PadR family transcriptional regulator [Longimicrobium sp.]|nr:PadR family transcriptional regulator [Longimicrobium sp.]